MATLKLPPEIREEIQALYATGNYSYGQLAAKYGVSINTISRCINDPTGEKTREENRRYYQENAKAINLRTIAANKEFRLKLNRKSDREIIEFLESKENFRQYILGLIKEDMNKQEQ